MISSNNKEKTMSKTVSVSNGEKKGEYKVLVNFVQRGTTLHSPELANKVATDLAKSENAKNLFLI